MSRVTDAYLSALELVNASHLARETGRGLSTLAAYKSGDRRVTTDAATELVAYLRERAAALTKAADKLDAAVTREKKNG